jgi:hypothetical protein
LEHGESVEQDLPSAAWCVKKAADLGNAAGMCNYGVLLETAWEVAQAVLSPPLGFRKSRLISVIRTGYTTMPLPSRMAMVLTRILFQQVGIFKWQLISVIRLRCVAVRESWRIVLFDTFAVLSLFLLNA